MFKFSTSQITYEFNGIKVGGQPGVNPPVLVGSIFYHKHKIVEDEHKGVFNKAEAEALIKNVEELSDKTRLPFMFDVVGSTPEAIVKYIEFVTSVTKAPILVDTLGAIEVSKAALKYVKETGLINKVIYNSVTAKSKDEEYKLLQEYGVKATIALLYTDKIIDVKSRLEALEVILQKAKIYNVEKILVDSFVIDVPSLSAACRAMIEIKTRYGLPVGMGAHNAVSAQKKVFKERFGAEGYKACEFASNLMPIILGADFLLYGPIESSKEVFSATYIIYNSYRYLSKTGTLIQLQK
jgi:tetrahydromethanopterin S-methyltransferase subunit H